MDSAKRLLRKPAEVLAPVFVDKQNASVVIEQLIGGHNPSQPAAGNDNLGLLTL
jgi:hypothetical protein